MLSYNGKEANSLLGAKEKMNWSDDSGQNGSRELKPMVDYSGSWDKKQVKQFLDGQNIPARLSFIADDNQPWMLSLWYKFDNEILYCATNKDADVVGHLRDRPYCAFEISTNELPYQGVRGKGTVTISPDENLILLKELVDRYVDDEYDTFRNWLLGREVPEVQIALEPDKIYSWDYSDRMQSISE